MKTGIVTSDTSLNHNTGTGHPEKPDRVTAVINNLKRNKQLIWKKPVKFNKNILNITHTAEYIKNVQNSFPTKGLIFLDGDTIVSPGSKDATIDAVGSIISAIEGVENIEFLSFPTKQTAISDLIGTPRNSDPKYCKSASDNSHLSF